MIKGFILTAGLGERLRPITNQIPKPMLPILGKPVIDYAIERLCCVKEIAFNLHYKSEFISKWLLNHSKQHSFHIFYEPTILGTGGALKNAEVFLKKSESFITYNGDVYSDLDISILINAHQSGQSIATLAVVDYPSINTLCIDKDGFLKSLSKEGKRTFTGIAIYSPKILDFIPCGNSSVVDAWFRAIKAGYYINTLDISNCYWSDIGTIAGYAKTILDVLKSHGEEVYISKTFNDCNNLCYEGFLVIEDNCSIQAKVKTKDVIILPDTIIEKSIDIHNALIGKDMTFAICNYFENSPIGSGGSERSFYRIKKGDTSIIKMQCKPNDTDFERHIAYTIFFNKHSIPVPLLIEVDRENKSATFEDLGQLSLYNWMKCRRSEDYILEMYKKVIDAMIQLHLLDCINDSQAPSFRVFDYEYFKWETDYFTEQFLKGYMNLNIDFDLLQQELASIAYSASRLKKTIIHRDLQSQNIMIKHQVEIAFIDYQGARLGPPAYDCASLLYDPYVNINDSLKQALWQYYCSIMHERLGLTLEELNESLQICKLQRLMQAIGAFCFLSQVKGKRYFLKHIPKGLTLLKEAINHSRQSLPYLYNIMMTDRHL